MSDSGDWTLVRASSAEEGLALARRRDGYRSMQNP